MARRNHQSHRPETLAGLAAKELDVWCWCDECSHSAVLAIGGSDELVGARLIKGNISSSGDRIYHLPGQQHDDETKISEGNGER